MREPLVGVREVAEYLSVNPSWVYEHAAELRRTCFDASGRPWDREAAAALHVADVLDVALSRRSSPEPIEVGRAAALGLLNVFQDNKDADDVFAHVARSDDVAALYLELRRFVRAAA